MAGKMMITPMKLKITTTAAYRRKTVPFIDSCPSNASIRNEVNLK